MTAEDLKKSILQQAIQGKLVPQCADDEPASALLDRIRAEKARLIAEGKIKRDKNESVIYRTPDGQYIERIGKVETDITDQIPFEIPESWEWVRLGNLSYNYDYKRVPLSVNERSKLAKIYDYYGASGVIDKVDDFLFDKPLLLIGEDGANLINRSTPIAFIANGQYWVNNHAHVLDYLCFGLMKYVCVFINAIPLTPFVTGTAQPKMNQEKMNSILVSLPPLAEQKRIVAKIEELMPMVEEYGRAQSRLDELNSSLSDNIRKSVLQYAIQGKLIPQDPDDEPASALLDRICAEKARLVSEGKIKRDKNESVIYRNPDGQYIERIGKTETDITDQIPFEIPDSWEWVRLGSIVDFSKSDSVKPNQIESNAWLLDLEDIEKDSGRVLQKKIWEKVFSKSDKHIFHKGNVLYSKLRPYLNKVVIADEDGYCTSEILCFDFGLINSSFAQIYLMSPFFVDYAMSEAYGVKMPRLGSQHGNKAFMPMPPLAEQKRIVERINEILSLYK